MAEKDGAAKKNPAVAALHSHFIVGSVSEENSEDEVLGRPDLQLEEKETRSLSPSSDSSSSTFEMGFDNIEGPNQNLRLKHYHLQTLNVNLQCFCFLNVQIFLGYCVYNCIFRV